MTCPDCERYKQSASMWRNKAYELNGTPLPWKPDELWVGLTDEEMVALCQNGFGIDPVLDGNLRKYAKAIEAKLKEKNT